MNEAQRQWFEELAVKIPRLFADVAKGNEKALWILGTRNLHGRQVRLSIVVEVMDAGGNPLASHSSGLTRTAHESLQARQEQPVDDGYLMAVHHGRPIDDS